MATVTDEGPWCWTPLSVVRELRRGGPDGAADAGPGEAEGDRWSQAPGGDCPDSGTTGMLIRMPTGCMIMIRWASCRCGESEPRPEAILREGSTRLLPDNRRGASGDRFACTPIRWQTDPSSPTRSSRLRRRPRGAGVEGARQCARASVSEVAVSAWMLRRTVASAGWAISPLAPLTRGGGANHDEAGVSPLLLTQDGD
jgi:hypothetical protein